jgi:preprotein translocase subunit YajC
MFWIAEAYAQAAGAPAGPSGIEAMIQLIGPFIIIIPIIYFMIIRPQQRMRKQHADLLAGIAKGDTIITAGGLIGKVKGVADDELRIELAPNVEVRMLRGSVAEVKNKTAPAPANDSKPAKTAQ